jgi:methyl-accepting chemotaxis protein
MKLALAAKLFLSFLVAACLLAATAVFCWQHIQTLQTSTETATQAEQVAQLAQTLVNQLRDSESGQLGFITTGDTLYLESYAASAGQVGLTLKQLYAIPNRSQSLNQDLQQLDGLIEKKLHEFNVSIQLRRTQALIKPAADVIRKTKGRTNTDSIRIVAQHLQNEHYAIIKQERQQTLNQATTLLWTAFAAGGGALVLVLVLGWASTFALVRSLKTLTTSVEQFAVNDLYHRVPQQPVPETQAIAIALNTMAAAMHKVSMTTQGSHNQVLEALNASATPLFALKAVRDQRGSLVDFTILLCNPAAISLVRTLGGQPFAVQGARLLTVLPNSRTDGLFAALENVVSDGNANQTSFTAKSGTPLQLHASKYGDGVVVTFWGA